MFRDSRGVVHTISSPDPLEDLPPGVAKALQSALLAAPTGEDTVDLGTVLERCDAVRELVERWQDAFFAALPEEVDLEEEARWAAEAGLSLQEVEAGYEEEDDSDLDLELLGLDDDEDEDDELEDLELLLEGDGVQADDDPRRLLPEQLVSVLERELLLLSVRVRLEALVATVDLVDGWSELLSDHEKLLGHLVLAHHDVPKRGKGGAGLVHERLAGRHAELHDGHGPSHPEGEAEVR